MAETYRINCKYQAKWYKGEGHDYSPHFHDGCEIFIFLNGDADYFIEKTLFPLKPYDLFITREDEVHTPILRDMNIYERFYIQFDREFFGKMDFEGYDLLACFYNRPKGQNNKLQLNGFQLTELREFMKKIIAIEDSNVQGKLVLRQAYLLEFLVFINSIYISTTETTNISNLPEKLTNILDFIDENIHDELSLEILEEKFYLNRQYICRLFNKSTGMKLHDYITFKRITYAKKYLKEGLSVTDAAHKSGFRDYSNFIRVFKKNVGTSPGRFSRQQINFDKL